MDLVEFCQQLQTVESCMQLLRNRGILKNNPPRCPQCRRQMTQVRDNTYVLDGYIWRCRVHKGKKKSIRTGSFLGNAHIQLKTFVLLAYTWSFSISSAIQEELCQVSSHTVVDYNQFFRDVCSRWLLLHPMNPEGVDNVLKIGKSDIIQVWRQQHGRKTIEAFDNLLHQISLLHPVN